MFGLELLVVAAVELCFALLSLRARHWRNMIREMRIVNPIRVASSPDLRGGP